MDTNSDFKNEFKAFIKLKGLTISDLAREFNLTPQAVSDYLKRGKLPVDKAKYISEKYGANYMWLSTGEKPYDNNIDIIVGDNNTNRSTIYDKSENSNSKILTTIITEKDKTINLLEKMIADRDKTIAWQEMLLKKYLSKEELAQIGLK